MKRPINYYYYYYHGWNNENATIPVYIEKFNRQEGYLLADFTETAPLENFIKQADVGREREDKRTMLEISNLNIKDSVRLREGSHYALPKELLEKGLWKAESTITQDNRNSSPVFAYRMDAKDVPVVNFGKAVPYRSNPFLKLESDIVLSSSSVNFLKELRAGKDTEVIVRNVGQGNWNDIHLNEDRKIIYDFGASVRSSKHDLEVLMRKFKIDSLFGYSCPVLIISHWDIDHYMALFGLTEKQIKSIGLVLCMDNPTTQTAKNAFKLLEDNLPSDRIIKLSPEERRYSESASQLHSVYRNSGINIFKGTRSSSRNKSGLVVSIENAYSNVVLPADHHYHQIEEYVFPYLNTTLRFQLVVPHHGGRAGIITPGFGTLRNKGYATISVGGNSYGHPFDAVKDGLRALSFDVNQTNLIGSDIYIPLVA